MPTSRLSLLAAAAATAACFASPASAADRSCFELRSVDTLTDHQGPGQLFDDPDWAGTWQVSIRADGSLRLVADPDGQPARVLTLDATRQSAKLEVASDGDRRPMATGYAWSRPPTTWCSDQPIHLQAAVSGDLGALAWTSFPVDSVVALPGTSGPNPMGGPGGPVALAGPGLVQGTASAAPRPVSPAAWTVWVAIDVGGGLVVPVHFHYAAVSAEGVASSAPAPPPTLAPPVTTTVEPRPVDDEPAFEEAGDEEEEEGRRTSYAGDASSGWFHIGGGFGLVQPVQQGWWGAGRFALGVGGYTFGFYGGAGFEMDWGAFVPWKVHGVAYLGVHLPIPVFHPMFGFKFAGGGALDPLTGAGGPSLSVGGQAGFILREFDGKPGFRFMVEPAFALTGMGNDVGTFELWFVFAGVM